MAIDEEKLLQDTLRNILHAHGDTIDFKAFVKDLFLWSLITLDESNNLLALKSDPSEQQITLLKYLCIKRPIEETRKTLEKIFEQNQWDGPLEILKQDRKKRGLVQLLESKLSNRKVPEIANALWPYHDMPTSCYECVQCLVVTICSLKKLVAMLLFILMVYLALVYKWWLFALLLLALSVYMYYYLPSPYKRAIDYLKHKYKTEDSEIMKNYWGILNINYVNYFSIKEMFIELEVTKGRDAVRCYNEVFSEIKNHVYGKIIVLKGNAGMGKSTYMHKIVYDWAMNCTEEGKWLNAIFDLVILMRLRDLKKEEDILEAWFSKYFGKQENMFAETSRYAEAVKHFRSKEENQKRTLFILDGLDEYNGDWNELYTKQLKKYKGNATVIVSSRIPHSQKIASTCTISTTLQTTGFDERKILENTNILDRVENLESALQDNNKKELFTIPLFLGVRVTFGHIPSNLYILLDDFRRTVISRYLEMKKSKDGADDRSLENLKNRVPNSLSELAFVFLKTGECSSDLEEIKKNHDKTFETCCEIGLLWEKWVQDSSGKLIPYFPLGHKLFIEFFAAWHAAKANDPKLIETVDKEMYEHFSDFFSYHQEKLK